MNRRTKWTLALALLALAGILVGSACVLLPRYLVAKRRRDGEERRRSEHDFVMGLLSARPRRLTGSDLAIFPTEPAGLEELVDGVVDECEHAPPHVPFQLWDDAFELWAVEPEPRDRGPLERLEALSRDTSLKETTRLELLYLIEELREPTYRAALDLPADPWLRGMSTPVLEALRELAPIDLDPGLQIYPEREIDQPPPGALARIAQDLRADVVREGARFKIRKRDEDNSAQLISRNTDDAPDSRFRDELDPAWGTVDEWIRIECQPSGRKWLLLGRDGARLGLLPENREPLKFFRALCALRGLTPPRKIAERVYETAPIASATAGEKR